MRLLINSMPKSGTHLLVKTVELLGYQNFLNSLFKKVLSKLGLWVPSSLIYEGVNRNIAFLFQRRNYEATVDIGVMSPVAVSYRLSKKWLQRVGSGSYIAGHVPYSEEFKDLLHELYFKHILIIRDPRDVIVSMAHYMARPEHSASKNFKKFTFEDRIRFLMDGGVLDNRPFIGFKEAYKKVLLWNETDCLVVRFEDLVGGRGGGSVEEQRKTIYRIAKYLGKSDEGLIKSVCENIYDPSSPTFRRGEIGAWKDEFPVNLLKEFNTEMEKVLRTLGYDV